MAHATVLRSAQTAAMKNPEQRLYRLPNSAHHERPLTPPDPLSCEKTIYNSFSFTLSTVWFLSFPPHPTSPVASKPRCSTTATPNVPLERTPGCPPCDDTPSSSIPGPGKTPVVISQWPHLRLVVERRRCPASGDSRYA